MRFFKFSGFLTTRSFSIVNRLLYDFCAYKYTVCYRLFFEWDRQLIFSIRWESWDMELREFEVKVWRIFVNDRFSNFETKKRQISQPCPIMTIFSISHLNRNFKKSSNFSSTSS